MAIGAPDDQNRILIDCGAASTVAGTEWITALCPEWKNHKTHSKKSFRFGNSQSYLSEGKVILMLHPCGAEIHNEIFIEADGRTRETIRDLLNYIYLGNVIPRQRQKGNIIGLYRIK